MRTTAQSKQASSQVDAAYQPDQQLLAKDEAATKTHHGLRGRKYKTGSYVHTRISAAWAAVIIAVMLGVALVDFIVQNTRTVRVEFFGASGRMPIAVALLAAALAGAFTVLIVGVCRTAQLRHALKPKKSDSVVQPSIPNAVTDLPDAES